MPPKQSPAWDYFTKTGTGKNVVAQCKKCPTKYTNPATSQLYYHLENVHHIFLDKLQSKKKPSRAPARSESEEFNADDPQAPDLDNMPSSTVERKGFKVFTRSLQQRYKPPSEPTLTKRLELKYEELKEAYRKKLAAARGICLTTDLWTHKNTMSSHLGVVAHFREGLKVRTIEIAARPMPESKSAENIQVALREICREWNIDYANVRGVVTDGGANIKNAVRNEFGSDKHIECVAHKINNIGQAALGLKETKAPSEEPTFEDIADELIDIPEDEEQAIDALDDLTEETDDRMSTTQIRALLMRVKKIVRFFRKSEVATSELISLQEAEGKKRHECRKLIQEVRTRWNSAFEMVDRFLDLSEHVSTALHRITMRRSSRATPPTMLRPDEQDILVEVRNLLRPLAEATKLVSTDKWVTISSVIPLVHAMKKEIDSFKPVSDLGRSLQKKLLEEIGKKFSGIEMLRPYAGATLLDPRFKQWAFDSTRTSAAIINHIAQAFADLSRNLFHTGQKVAAKVEENSRRFEAAIRQRQEEAAEDRPQSGIMAAMDRIIQLKTVGAPDQERATQMPSQLKNYLSLMPVDRHSNPNPIEIWESMKSGMEQLYEIALDYLPVFATSVSCERLFSHAGLIATTLRNRISPEHISMFVFLRSVDEEMWGVEKFL
ncbi:hypothetical protein FOCC_FOCC016560 [Frankliniella occidentalis]|nr:hypothetical protein FOCC_FOCC016560 [Frankliniella occidentalis]